VIVPPLEALAAALQADAELSAAIGQRVYVARVPGEPDPDPGPGVLLRHAGGPGAPRHAPLLAVRVDVHAYGPTPYAANLVHYAVHAALRRIERQTIAGTLLHSVLAEGGPVDLVDPVTQWPEVVSTWALLAAEEVPA
jgi:hypothetical protein